MPRRSKFFAVMNVHVLPVHEQYIKYKKNLKDHVKSMVLLFPGILWKFQNNYGMMVLKIYRSFTSAKNDDYNSSVYYENP